MDLSEKSYHIPMKQGILEHPPFSDIPILFSISVFWSRIVRGGFRLTLSLSQYVYIYIHTHIYIYLYNMHIYIYIHIHLYLYIHMYIYIYRYRYYFLWDAWLNLRPRLRAPRALAPWWNSPQSRPGWFWQKFWTTLLRKNVIPSGNLT